MLLTTRSPNGSWLIRRRNSACSATQVTCVYLCLSVRACAFLGVADNIYVNKLQAVGVSISVTKIILTTDPST